MQHKSYRHSSPTEAPHDRRSDYPAGESPRRKLPPVEAAEMRRYFEEQRGNALIRVAPGLWMFGSGN